MVVPSAAAPLVAAAAVSGLPFPAPTAWPPAPPSGAFCGECITCDTKVQEVTGGILCHFCLLIRTPSKAPSCACPNHAFGKPGALGSWSKKTVSAKSSVNNQMYEGMVTMCFKCVHYIDARKANVSSDGIERKFAVKENAKLMAQAFPWSADLILSKGAVLKIAYNRLKRNFYCSEPSTLKPDDTALSSGALDALQRVHLNSQALHSFNHTFSQDSLN